MKDKGSIAGKLMWRIEGEVGQVNGEVEMR